MARLCLHTAKLDYSGLRRAVRRLITGLRRHLDLNDVVLDGVNHQIADGMQAKFPHDVAAMSFYGLGAQIQKRRNFL